MFKVGLSTTGKEVNASLFESYKKAGIDAMEVSCPYEKHLTLDYDSLKKNANTYGVKLWSYHLPFKPFDIIDISDKNLRKGTVEFISELIKKAGAIGIDKYIIHSSGKIKRSEMSKDELYDKMQYAKESLTSLADVAQKSGGAVAVENLPPICFPTNSEEVRELVSADDRLRVCFDTNHMLSGDPVEFIKSFADKIITMHVSDYDLINERHWLPGEGVLNWQDIYNAFKEINYQGVWLYEIGFKSSGTITRERNLTCDDFARNAKEIFENKEFTVIPSVKNV